MKNFFKKFSLLSLFIITCFVFPNIIIKASDVFTNENNYGLSKEDNSDYLEEIEAKSKYLDTFEIESLRDVNAKHFRLANGSFKLVIYDGRVHYKDELGKWNDLYDYDLEDAIGGKLGEPLRIPPDIPPFIEEDDIGLYDTYISSSNPNANYGTSINAIITNDNSKYAFIKSLLYNVPSDATIDNATLKFLYYFGNNNTQNMTIGAYEVLSDWSEYNLKWTSNVSVSSTCASSFQTNANATSSNPLYAQFNITSLVKKWYIDESPNYGVAIKYMSGNASTLNIKTRENSGFHTSLIIGYNMDPIPISSGTYFLKNAELDKYVQIDDNDSNNNYSTEGAILELWTGNGANYQKWVFEYLHNGYYKVKSSHSNKVISVDYNYLNSDAHALVQETYNGSHRQQWSVLITPNGMYKIKPRSSENYSTDWVMCAGNGIIGNGRNVEQREYSNNADYKDEWIIINISNSYGCQTHRVLTQNQQSAINCHGYAMQRDDSPWYVDYGTGTIAWCHRTEEYVYSIQTLNATIKHNADVCIKLDFEEWLTESGYSWRYEPYFCSNGESVELNTNEYRVVLRYGINYVYGYIFHDYHFWYQTYDGTWSNKHGQYSEVNLGSGVNPFTTGTTGWALANYSDFYDGEIFSYIITIYE